VSQQDGKQLSTKQLRSWKTNSTNQQNGKQACPPLNDAEAWKAYWKAQGLEWRTEPEIDVGRQKFLANRRSIIPDIEKGIYPFKARFILSVTQCDN